jgi:hypothetical protein
MIQKHRCAQRAGKAGRLEQLFTRFRRTDDNIVTRAIRWAELPPFGPFVFTYGEESRTTTLQTEPLLKIRRSAANDAHANDKVVSLRDDERTIGLLGFGSI